MVSKVLFHPKAASSLNKLDSSIRQRVKDVLEELKESPERKGDQLRPSDYWRVRIGDYRVIFRIERHDNLVLVLFVGHRSKVYDDFSRMF